MLSARAGVMPGRASKDVPKRSNTLPTMPVFAAEYRMPASRDSGAGEIIALTKRSTWSKADSNGRASIPNRRRMKLLTMRTNLSQALIGLPSG